MHSSALIFAIGTLVAIVGVGLAGKPGKAREQSVCVKGKVTCESDPKNAANQEMVLHDDADRDDVIQASTTDDKGNFELCGSLEKIKKLKPVLKLYTECNNEEEEEEECHLKHKVKIDYKEGQQNYTHDFTIAKGKKGKRRCAMGNFIDRFLMERLKTTLAKLFAKYGQPFLQKVLKMAQEQADSVMKK